MIVCTVDAGQLSYPIQSLGPGPNRTEKCIQKGKRIHLAWPLRTYGSFVQLCNPTLG